jgi:hypothetical protein
MIDAIEVFLVWVGSFDWATYAGWLEGTTKWDLLAIEQAVGSPNHRIPAHVGLLNKIGRDNAPLRTIDTKPLPPARERGKGLPNRSKARGLAGH